jgi:hypothetical protein
VEEGSVLRRQISATTNSLSVSDRVHTIPWDLLWWWLMGFLKHSGSRASLS